MDINKIDKNMDSHVSKDLRGIRFIDLSQESLGGSAFNNKFNRLDKGDFVSLHVDILQHHTSGMYVTFTTDSTSIHMKASVRSNSYMAHMTAIGQIGFDLYYLLEDKFVFVQTTKVNQKEFQVTLLENLEPQLRTYRLYFPLYIGVKEAFVGIDTQASFLNIKENKEKIVIYGTSISQGGCATRPGMSYGNILNRITPYEVINLGFSGSAHLELDMAHIINRIEKKWLILEVEANNSDQDLETKLPAFLEALDCKQIILISHFPYAFKHLHPVMCKSIARNKTFQSKLPNIIFVDGEDMLNDLGYDETVDGVHLTDLGFWTVAQYLKGILDKYA